MSKTVRPLIGGIVLVLLALFLPFKEIGIQGEDLNNARLVFYLFAFLLAGNQLIKKALGDLLGERESVREDLSTLSVTILGLLLFFFDYYLYAALLMMAYALILALVDRSEQELEEEEQEEELEEELEEEKPKEPEKKRIFVIAKFFVTKITKANGIFMTERQILRLFYCVMSDLNHPITEAMANKYQELDSKGYEKILASTKNLERKELPSGGRELEMEGRKILVGKKSMMEDLGLDYQEEEGDGYALYLVVDGQFIGSILVQRKTVRYKK